MVYQCKTILDYAGDGAMPLLYSIRDCVPLSFPALLFGIFIILFAGQYFLIKNRTGRAKVLISMLSSSFSMILLSLLLSLAQLVRYKVVLFYAFLTILIYAIFQFSDES